MDDLNKYSLSKEPLESFINWYEAAKTIEQNPEAMTLSTIDLKNNRPDSRTVLFKGLKEGCCTFYTNYLSNKGRELEHNNEACLLFYWHASGKQVRIQGRVRKMTKLDSKTYFHSRDRQSQLASLVSEQSSPITNKDALMTKLADATNKYNGLEIPYPDNWGGFLLEPYEFEFFVYGDYRINDRFLFKKQNSNWSVTRLQP